ncbi:sigma-70 family RNA polymerase sigma factor [Thalassotalea sp. M1531]|uniref:Sigma-70 family RNA polymerase sigma factor n=1 Tax=Thalassotalea algicola TaxID=2716224 RepID=A0A7Y0Q706_9GAMM|nr:sigma-70 family RNA polymerase sigma factor [Thalassotalea algicola]NMP31983.1 sigma-70 family RNA polymerase sigma factor [Thalassotalea algicola]
MKLPSKIKGLLSTGTSPEYLWRKFYRTRKPEYLASLVQLFNQPLFHYLLTLTDASTAEDVIQTVWLKVLKMDTPQTSDIVVKSWLFKVARNSLIDELRRLNRWRYEELKEHTIELEVPLEIKVFDDRLGKFNWALSKLSFAQKEAFIFQQEGFSLMEICEITDESFETIKSRIRYAKANLKRLMS